MQIHLFNSILGVKRTPGEYLYLLYEWTVQASSSMLNKAEKIDVYYCFILPKRLSFLYFESLSTVWQCLLGYRFLHFVIRNLMQKLRWQLVKRNYVAVWNSHIQKSLRLCVKSIKIPLLIFSYHRNFWFLSLKPPHIGIRILLYFGTKFPFEWFS